MMRIAVLSDSHGDIASFRMAIKNEPDADYVIFLGDGIKDFDAAQNDLASRIAYAVKGNCDSFFSSDYEKRIITTIGGKRFYITHGDTEQVKFGLDTLKLSSYMSNADIVLFGHTHTPFIHYDEGMYFFNPGSVRQNSYGVIDINDSGIICIHKKIVR